MLEEMGNDPIQDAISAIEKEHEKDKEGEYRKPVFILGYIFVGGLK